MLFNSLPYSYGNNHVHFDYQNTIDSTTQGKRFVLVDVKDPTNPLTNPGVMTASGTVTGNYKTQYSPTFEASPGTAGTTTPTGSSNWYDSGASGIVISATANPGYIFDHWETTGSTIFANARSASTTMTVKGPETVTAVFAPNAPLRSITFAANGSFDSYSSTTNHVITIDGVSYTYPELQALAAFSLPEGSQHTVQVDDTLSTASDNLQFAHQSITGQMDMA